MEVKSEMLAKIEAWIAKAQEMRREYYAKMFKNLDADYHAALGVQYGKKFAKVISQPGTGHDSVYLFIDLANGDIYKAASWKAPAKHVRGNIAKGLDGVGPYGAQYLR